MKDQLLIIGLVVAFGVGYLVGDHHASTTVTYAPLNNYDPTKTVCEDTIKAQQEATERCYKDMVAHLERLNEKDKGITH